MELSFNPFGGLVRQFQQGKLALRGDDPTEHQNSIPVAYNRHGRITFHHEI